MARQLETLKSMWVWHKEIEGGLGVKGLYLIAFS